MLAIDNNKIFEVNNLTFKQQALDIFEAQYHQNLVYQNYVKALKINIKEIKELHQIPFLPIQFFKTFEVKTGNFAAEETFTSSGTTGVTTSSHFVKERWIYEKSYSTCYQQFYGNIEDYCIIGLLPSYLERTGSSLVYMVNDLIKKSNHPLSDFYLDEYEHLYLILQQLELDKQPTILFGVTFALIDFAMKFTMDFNYITIIETGGMKGRGKELTRQELHQLLQSKFGKKEIHSEYGMTELLSQAYTKKDGIFYTPNWMKVLIREENDPLTLHYSGKGLLNIIDLANVNSCAFIATDDIGALNSDGSFTVNGRMDNSDIRGCSLLVV
jgi:phenylacetate-coenzyme A ligase PaaK-like adenylate-forming protein